MFTKVANKLVLLKTNDMMEVEVGHKLMEFGQENKNEAEKGCVTLVRKGSKFRVNYLKSAKVKGKSWLSK